MDKDKYNVLYSITYKSGEFKAEDIETYGKETQVCDAFIFIPIIRYGDSRGKISFISFDGESKTTLKGKDFYFAWAALGHFVAEDQSLTEKERQIARWAAKSLMDENEKTNH